MSNLQVKSQKQVKIQNANLPKQFASQIVRAGKIQNDPEQIASQLYGAGNVKFKMPTPFYFLPRRNFATQIRAKQFI